MESLARLSLDRYPSPPRAPLRRAFAALRGFAVLLALLGLLPRPAAAADAAATIDEDTVWRGVVQARGPVVVEKGATLVVLPGTEIRFTSRQGEGGLEPGGLLVHGTLVAQGTAERPIVFTSGVESPAAGDWNGVRFERASGRVSRLRHCRLEYATWALHGTMSSVLVEDSVLRRSQRGVYAAKALRGGLFGCEVTENGTGVHYYQNSELGLENSRIHANSGSGVECFESASAHVANCVIEGNGDAGIVCRRSSSGAIEGNLIRGNKAGIVCDLMSEPVIANNEIRANDAGIVVLRHAVPIVSRNLVVENRVGILCNLSGYPVVQGNNVVGNREFAFVLGDNQSIAADRVIGKKKESVLPDALGLETSLAPGRSPEPPPLRPEDGIVLASRNWWGPEVTAQMAAVGPRGNVDALEDFRDRPYVEYRKYPRDAVEFAPWEEQPVPDAGRPERRYAGVRGRVLFEDGPFEGARVYAYGDPAGDFRDEGVTYSPPTDAAGRFSLRLRPGRYYLVAKRCATPLPWAEPEVDDWFGYLAANPVDVSEGEEVEADLRVVRRRPTAVAPSGGGAAVGGTVLGPGGPATGARVYAYPDGRSGFRGPDAATPGGSPPEAKGPEAAFALELPPGTYYLTAVKPNGAGELFGYFDGNPVTVEAGRKVSVVLQVTP